LEIQKRKILHSLDCVLAVVRNDAEFFRKENCGMCTPCREGTRRTTEILEQFHSYRDTVKQMTRLELFHSIIYLKEFAEIIQQTSHCGFGKASSNAILSSLRWFGQEYEAHIYERNCGQNANRSK